MLKLLENFLGKRKSSGKTQCGKDPACFVGISGDGNVSELPICHLFWDRDSSCQEDRLWQNGSELRSALLHGLRPKEEFSTRYRRGSFCRFLNAFVYSKCSKIRTKFQPKFRWPKVKIRKLIALVDLDEQCRHVWFWICLFNAFYNLSYCETSSDCTTVLPRNRDMQSLWKYFLCQIASLFFNLKKSLKSLLSITYLGAIVGQEALISYIWIGDLNTALY